MYQKLRTQAERVNADVVRFTQDLVRTPSPSLAESDVAAKVESMMRDLDFDLVFTDDVGNVVGVIFGGDPRFSVILNSHMDTVSADDGERWSSSPFSGEIDGDRITGLGAAGCKSGIAEQVFAAHVLANSALPLKGNVVVAATVAEENGCSIGVRHLFERTLPQIGMEPRFVILGEPTGLKVNYGHDGWVRIDVDVTGLDNERTIAAADQLYADLAALSDGQGTSGLRSIMLAEPPEPMTGVGGMAVRIGLCRRLFTGETAEHFCHWFDDELTRCLRNQPPVALRVHVHEEEQTLYTGHVETIRTMTRPWQTDLAHPLVDRVRIALQLAGFEWNPRLWVLDRLGMGTAGAFLTTEVGLPTLGFGPGEESQAHARNESVSVPSLVQSVYGSAAVVHGLVGVPSTSHQEHAPPLVGQRAW